MMRMRLAAGILCIVMGILVFMMPQIKTVILRGLLPEAYTERSGIQISTEDTVEERKTEAEETEPGRQNDTEEPEENIYAYMEMYNRKLYEQGQELGGAVVYEQDPVSNGRDAIGTISIPDMNVELPLFIGATYEHLDRGAAVLGGTSMPVGGINTNCVILGHRSWCGVPFFRDIDLLKEGSLVRIDNGREILYYRAFEKNIILPDDTEAILIRPGMDMITLISCHPYMGGGTHRYVVYCRRCEEEPVEEEQKAAVGGELPKAKDSLPEKMENMSEDPSRKLIQGEKVIRFLAALFIVFLLTELACRRKKQIRFDSFCEKKRK